MTTNIITNKILEKNIGKCTSDFTHVLNSIEVDHKTLKITFGLEVLSTLIGANIDGKFVPMNQTSEFVDFLHDLIKAKK
jgi:hypothetical protein